MVGTPDSFADRDGTIWMNGDFVDWRDARVHVLTNTLHYGVGCFEGVRAYSSLQGAQIFRLEDHTRRLFDSAKILRMEIPYSFDTLVTAQIETVRRNKLDSAYIRPLVFFGSEAMGLHVKGISVNVSVAAWSWPSYMDPTAYTEGIRVQTSSYTRHHVNISMCKAKAVGQYVNSILALSEAIDGGYDEALLLDTEGFVSECSGQNVFLVKNGVVHTPELASCLAGITRDTIMTFASELGMEVVERRLSRDEFYIADECFITGSAAEVLPVCELDCRIIGDGTRGPLTKQLQKMYFDQVQGKTSVHPEWLTLVE